MSIEEKIQKIRKIRHSEMSEILPNLFLGSRLNSTNKEEIRKNGICRILAIHDRKEEHRFDFLNYKFIKISDSADANISDVFGEAVQFIHEARIRDEPVLVHCLMGQSRSATVICAYLATFYELDGPTCLQFVRKRRKQVNPNVGFIMQLNKYAKNFASLERARIIEITSSSSSNLNNPHLLNNDSQIINKYCPFAVNIV
ncbi:unnamed protein product [Caenorhabditis angaria]|uniref:Protein-tyrosine-phosphatase n=1 Tax=Caenorhabditis angaria TaxID=860376 RepID=A0A9P1IID6_9PELO|nr:unnamed protein product [Caenorhabditis angaria]